MANKLKIYACSGINKAAAKGRKMSYWTDETKTIANTQAVNTLLAMINSRYIIVNKLRGITDAQKCDYLNDIDMLSVALEAAKRFKDNQERLRHAGQVIAVMLADGEFDSNILNSNEREEHLEQLISRAHEAFEDDKEITGASANFMAWWKTTVEERNVVGLNTIQQEEVTTITHKKITPKKRIKTSVGEIDPDWQENDDLSNYLLNGGTYFMYLFFTEAQLAKLPGVFKVKRQGQLRTYNYCKQLFVDVYGSEDEMIEIIRASIVGEFGATPEEVCESIIKGDGVNGVGDVVVDIVITVKELITIISVIAGALLAIVYAICDCVYKSNAAKYGALDKAIVDASCPDDTDYSELEKRKKTSTSSWLPYAAIGLGLVFLLKN